jgi:hypothetical protein
MSILKPIPQVRLEVLSKVPPHQQVMMPAEMIMTTVATTAIVRTTTIATISKL